MNDKDYNINNKSDKIELPEYIEGYKIEREYGNRNIEDCIRELISIHI